MTETTAITGDTVEAAWAKTQGVHIEEITGDIPNVGEAALSPPAPRRLRSRRRAARCPGWRLLPSG